MLVLLSLLSAAAPPSAADPEVRALRRIRTAGVVASLAGPAVGFGGGVMLLRGAVIDDAGLVTGGTLITSAGAIATLSGPPLVLIAGHAAGRLGDRGPSDVGAAVAWSAFAATPLLVVAGSQVTTLWFFGAGASYATALFTGWAWTNTRLRRLPVDLVVAPSLGRDRVGLQIGGRF